MQIRVEIQAPAEKKLSKANNVYYLQQAYVHLRPPYPERVEFFPPSNSPGYAPGIYELDLAASIGVRQGRLVISDMVLRPVQPGVTGNDKK